jgi:lipopolysaccharide export LptBFGC system permease protein LptF
VAYSKLYHACMRRASWLELACPKILGSTFPVALAIAALVKFSAAHASQTPSDREKTAAVAKAQIATKYLVMEQNTVSSPLPDGDTTFIIFLARSSTLDRFTFINENKPARGELRIAVANEKLSADSDKWTSVDGAVSFQRKRLFNVSMLGVEAKYIRLTFHIQHEENVGWVSASKAIALN